ncbi:hypothetical protein [Psychrobacter sp. TB55-MNA-CIBAN-0194]|uniref:hypothetical protein n=1 Tax=Psychrobacter sp. TB55-MNA-CIBAN-0194 TaxID=3140445 RepID=UPI00333459E4
MTESIKVKKWVSLGVIATALLLLPRRSSRKSDMDLLNKNNAKSDSSINSSQNANNGKEMK